MVRFWSGRAGLQFLFRYEFLQLGYLIWKNNREKVDETRCEGVRCDVAAFQYLSVLTYSLVADLVGQGLMVARHFGKKGSRSYSAVFAGPASKKMLSCHLLQRTNENWSIANSSLTLLYNTPFGKLRNAKRDFPLLLSRKFLT